MICQRMPIYYFHLVSPLKGSSDPLNQPQNTVQGCCCWLLPSAPDRSHYQGDLKRLGLDIDLVADLYPNTAVFLIGSLHTLQTLLGDPNSGHQLEASSAHPGCLSSDPFLWENHSQSAAACTGESKHRASQFYNKIPALLAKH